MLVEELNRNFVEQTIEGKHRSMFIYLISVSSNELHADIDWKFWEQGKQFQ